MKKSLLLLFSLLIFVGNVWGDYTFTYPNKVSLETAAFGDKRTEISLGESFNIVSFNYQAHTDIESTLVNFKIGTKQDESDIDSWNPDAATCKKRRLGICWEYNDDNYQPRSRNVNKSFSTIYFLNPNPSAGRTLKNIVLTVATTTIGSLGKVEANKSSKNTTCNVLAASKPGKSDFTFYNGNSQITDGSFSISSVKSSGYSHTITISFSPKEVKVYKDISIKFNGGVVATISGEGTLAAPTNLKVEPEYTISASNDTIVGYGTANLSWKEVSDANQYFVYIGENGVASTNTTSIQLTGLALGQKFENVAVRSAKVVNKDTIQSANTSNKIKFTTKDLKAPDWVKAGTTSYTSIPLSWKTVDDADGYMIINKTSGDRTVIEGGYTDATTITGLEMDKSYTFEVHPMVNGLVSSKYTQVTTDKTKKYNVTTAECQICTNTESYGEQTILMSSGEKDYPSSDGYVLTGDQRYKYTSRVSFDIRKGRGFVGSVYDLRMYVRINKEWKYIWNANYIWYAQDKDDDDYPEKINYTNCSVDIPNNVTAIKFVGSSFSGWIGDWMKYGGEKRYIKNVKVYMGAEAIATPAELDYEVYIGQKNTDDNTKTFNLKYSNKVTDGAKFDIDNKKFSGTFPTINSCTIGNEKDIPVSFYTEELNSNGEQGSLTIVTGDVASVSLNATVKALPAPKDLEANATGKSSVTLTWEENPGDDNKALGLASGYYVRYKKSSAESYGDPVFVARKTEDTNYSHTVPSLEDGTEYNFKVTTIYTDSKSNKIENEYAEITTSTYSTVTVSKNGGISSVTPFYYITCSNGGSWNVNEKSFAKGATAVITPVQTLECDKYKDANVNEGDPVTGETISFEVNTPSTVKLNYEFGLSTPVINSITVNGKSSVTLSWYNVSCSSSYTLFIYKSGEKRTIEGVSTPYTVTELEEGTDYEFALQAIRNDGETEYTSAESSHIPATTYSTLKVETDGEYAEQIEFTLAGEEGKWNSTEKSFAKDSKATITASLKEGVTCAIFDKILVGETEYTENPAEITMTAPATATISYKFAGLEKPTVVVSESNSKDKISISWNSVDCAESYTVYNGDEEVATGIITATEYKFENLTPATEYQFNVKAVNGDKSAESDAVNATTYTTSMNVEVEGIFGSDQVVYSITSTAMNTDEKSYAIGSTATVGVTTLPASCVVDKIEANGVDISATATFTVAAENNVKITYRYTGTGVAEVIGGQIYETLNEAVEAVHDGGTINLLGDVPTQDLSVSGKHIEFNGNGHSISNLYIESDGSVDLIGDVVVVNDFGLEISTSNSGQFTQTNAQIEVRGKAYVDKALDPNGVGNERCWYSVAVPFEVSYTDGIYAYINGDWKKVTFNKDFILKEYDGALRAASTTKLQGWVLPTTENIVPGKFYLMGLGYNGPNVFRFYKATGKDLITAENSIAINKYESSNDMNAGWNGIGNLKLFNVGIESAASGFAQVLHNGKFMTVELSSSKFAVTTPMFIQSSINTTADFSRKTNGTLRSVAASSGIYNLRIRKENASDYSDQMFASASYETIGQYTIGRDLAKMEVSTGYPQIYTRAFNANLSVHEAQYNEKGVAGMPLYMYAPAAGNYTLNLGKEVYDGTSLLLIKDGVEIHNFNVDGAYTLYLAKGTNSSYSLQISSGEGGDIPTPVADATSNNKVHVYVSNGVLVIENLASGENYTVGNLIRTLHYGTSSGSKITIPLATKGVYWVKAGTTSVKVLNN